MHIKNGWNFGRLPDGGVKITQVDLDAPEDNDSAPLAVIMISASEWQSVIAGMSAYESSAQAFDMAAAFHTASPQLHHNVTQTAPVDNEASKEAFLKHQAEHHAPRV